VTNTVQETMIPTWTLADRLRKAREHAGLEQSELADRDIATTVRYTLVVDDATRAAAESLPRVA